jgi:hypothetical protein
MKRVFAVSSILVLAGCPIYSDDSYRTPASSSSSGSSGYSPICSSPQDCAYGTCSSSGTCSPQSCSAVGCVAPYRCVVESGVASCREGSVQTDAGKPDAPLFSGCRADSECTAKGAGAKCLSGECTAREDQCSDATQCRTGQQCVDGACTQSCSASIACPNGFSCDTAKGVCTGNSAPCASTASCASGNTCVEGRCVSKCGASPQAQCAAGLVCIDGGCTVDERPVFSCTTDGQLGTGAPGTCAVASICLRKSCYIACDPASADACKTADQFNQCKQVTTASGPHDVCGSTSNLGGECDIAASKLCAGSQVCIDGFCR